MCQSTIAAELQVRALEAVRRDKTVAVLTVRAFVDLCGLRTLHRLTALSTISSRIALVSEQNLPHALLRHRLVFLAA